MISSNKKLGHDIEICDYDWNNLPRFKCKKCQIRLIGTVTSCGKKSYFPLHGRYDNKTCDEIIVAQVIEL